MSEIMTVASLPGAFGGGYMDYGRLTRAEIIRRTRVVANAQKEAAEKVLSAPDEAFECKIVRGKIVQKLIERL